MPQKVASLPSGSFKSFLFGFQKVGFPGPLARFFCFLGDLSLGYLAYFTLHSFKGFAQWEEELTVLLKAAGWSLSSFSREGLVMFLLVLGLTQALRLYTTLALGVSFFQSLGGLRARGSWGWKRLGGAGRVVLDTLIGWSFIPYLPILVARKSLVEKWTLTELVKRKGFKSSLLRSLAIPLFLVISLLAPLLFPRLLIDGLVLVSEKPKRENIGQALGFDRFTVFASERFKFKTFSSLKDGRFVLLPDFDIVQQGIQRKITPYLSLYDRENQRLAHWKIRGKLSLLEVLQEGQRGNPFFHQHYPELGKIFLGEKQRFEVTDYEEKLKRPGRIDPLEKEQMEELIRVSLRLGFSNIGEHFLKYGPFLGGYARIHHKFLGLLRPGGEVEADFISMGNGQFLRFHQSFSQALPYRKQQLETWIPMGTPNAVVMEFGWDKDVKSALSRKAFRETFLSQAEWFFDYKNFFPFPKQDLEMTPFQVIDFLTVKGLNQERRELIEEFLYRFYYEMGRFALQSQQAQGKLFLDFLKDNLARVRLVLEARKKRESSSFNQAFLDQMRDISHALMAQDEAYFRL